MNAMDGKRDQSKPTLYTYLNSREFRFQPMMIFFLNGSLMGVTVSRIC